MEEYLTSWLKIIEPTVAPRTHYRYETLVRVHIVPALGKTPLAHLTPQQVQSFYAQKLKEGLSRGTLMLLRAVVHRALEAVTASSSGKGVADRVADSAPRAGRRRAQRHQGRKAATGGWGGGKG